MIASYRLYVKKVIAVIIQSIREGVFFIMEESLWVIGQKALM